MKTQTAVDVLLIQPPIRDFYLTAKRTIPYGLACNASALENEGFSVSILDCLATSRSRISPWPVEMEYLRPYYGRQDISPFSLFHHFRHFGYSFEHLENVVRRVRPLLVGVSSLFTAYSGEAIQAAEIVKAVHPHGKVVLGGHHPTELPEHVMENRAVDFVLRGEGEVSMPALARTLKGAGSLLHVPGLVFRRDDGSLHVNPPAVMKSLNDSRLPSYPVLELKHYKRGRHGSAVVVASRGCPMRCTYCSLGASSAMGYKRRSTAGVLAEMEMAVTRYGIRFIDFEDENLSLDRSWFMELLEGIRVHFGGCGLELRAMNGLFPPSLDEELISAMKEAGFRTLNLSLGTTSVRQARRFKRPDVTAAFGRAVCACKRMGLQAVGYIVVGAPDQSASDSLADLLYLAGRPVIAGVSVYYPSPGSEDYTRCAELGVLPEHFSLMRSTALPVSHATTRDDSVTLLRLGRILNFMKALSNRSSNLSASPCLAEAGGHGLGERGEVGKFLLSLFFRDGKIRGMTPEGEVYEHRTSIELCKLFINGLEAAGFTP